MTALVLDDCLGALRAAQPKKRGVLEVVDLQEALAMARAGADVLVSSAPYHAPPADVKMVSTRGE